MLVSRLKDGSSVTFAERYVLPRLQQCIDRLEEEGVRLILFFCTGDFPDNFRHKVPLIFPNQILFGLVPVLCAGKLAAVTPSEKQLEPVPEEVGRLRLGGQVLRRFPLWGDGGGGGSGPGDCQN